MIYRTKLGTIPYANVVSDKPLVVGERFWLEETTSFKNQKPIYNPKHTNGLASCLVDKIDGDVLFLSRF